MRLGYNGVDMILSEILVFLKKYWWVGIIAFFLTASITTAIGSSIKTRKILELQEQTYQEEKKVLQEAHKKEMEEITARLEQFEKDKKDLEEKHAALREELKKKKTQIINHYHILWENDFDNLEKDLEDLFDIEKYEPGKSRNPE